MISLTHRSAGAGPCENLSFEGAVALVTGGGSGIGRATALALAELGATVVVTGRRERAITRTAQLQSRITAAVGDVSQPEDAKRLVETTARRFGRLDVLVNNAGAVVPTPLGGSRFEAARLLWATNVLGPSLLAEYAVGYLEQTRGAIINISSSFGHKPAPGLGHYGASKAAVEHLTRSWALELADRGIRVNAIAPGPTETEALAQSGLPAEVIETIKQRERQEVPLGRRGEPHEIARWVIALADPASSWITGQVIGVDGGFALR